MTLKPNNYYEGKISGEFLLKKIKNVGGKPIFAIQTLRHSHIELSLAEMREEKPKAV